MQRERAVLLEELTVEELDALVFNAEYNLSVWVDDVGSVKG